MAITIDEIKALRARTGAGVMDCRSALTEAEGDLDKAQVLLRKKGVQKAAQRAEKDIRQGLVEAYVHSGRIGAMVVLNCETDFVARTDLFKQLAHDIAMQVASMNPRYVSQEQIPDDVDGSPDELALLCQPFIKDPTKTVQDLISEAVSGTGEKIELSRFTRFVLSE